MENRFLEMDVYLKKITGKSNGSRRTGYNTASSFSESTFLTKSLTVDKRSLVILIENGGVDLGIPELADRLINLTPVRGLIPDSVRGSFIDFLRVKIKEFTDNLLESAELTINRYSSSAPDLFNTVTVLRNGNAAFSDLKNTLIQLSDAGKIVDLLILTHGSSDYISVKGGIDSKKIRSMKTEYGKPLSIRSVYMMNCQGSTLNQAWLDAGAKVSSGAIRNNYLPEPTTYFFWKKWKEGETFEAAVTGAYRKTINIMNAAVNTFVKSTPLINNVSFNFEDYDFVKDSAPVIQGIGSVTINSDELSFNQTVSSQMATTVLPVNFFREMQAAEPAPLHKDRNKSWLMSQQCLDLIKKYEGFRSKMYNDAAGHCTIGYGTLLHKGNCSGEPSEKPYVNGITEEEAEKLLKKEANIIQRVINDEVTTELNQNQYDALVSFVYNIGTGAFKSSTLLKLLNKGDYKAVPGEIKKWTKARVNGKLVDLPGLVKRRDEEAAMFTAPVIT